MEIIKSSQGDFSILKLQGRFDAHEVAPVREWVKEQISQGKTRLVVDLGEVNFVDSSALSVLVQGLKNSRENGGDLAICSLQQAVRVIFELTRLDKAFSIYPTLAEAVESKS